MADKKLTQMGAWCAFGMAAALVINGVATFTGPDWLWIISRVLIVVFGLGVLPAVLSKIPPAHIGWATWATNLAYLGLGAEAISYLSDLQFSTVWLLFGGLGMWGVTVNILALRYNLWPRFLAWIGLASGLLLFCVILGAKVETLAFLGKISAGLGAVILYPAWLVWTGLRMRAE